MTCFPETMCTDPSPPLQGARFPVGEDRCLKANWQTIFFQSAVDAVQWVSHGTGDQGPRRNKQAVSCEPHPRSIHCGRKPSLRSYDWNLTILDGESCCCTKCVPGRGHRKCSSLVEWGSPICFETRDVTQWGGEVNAWEVSPLPHFERAEQERDKLTLRERCGHMGQRNYCSIWVLPSWCLWLTLSF